MLDLSKYKVAKKLRYFNGKSEVQVSDFIDKEVVTISIITASGERVNEKVVYNADLVGDVQIALDSSEIKSATIFKL